MNQTDETRRVIVLRGGACAHDPACPAVNPLPENESDWWEVTPGGAVQHGYVLCGLQGPCRNRWWGGGRGPAGAFPAPEGRGHAGAFPATEGQP